MFCVVLWTNDRGCLGDYNLRPGIQLRWDYGADLIELLANEGSGHLVKYSSYTVGEMVQV